ncbi:MAG: hypothetical protein MZV49_15480 [Rhodopseudomonas palustris]|nr:hypothetical protein [Rhodopseudomonas palustris]
MYGKGVDIYLAPTADARRHLAGARCGTSRCEGRCFVLGCNQFVDPGHVSRRTSRSRSKSWPAQPEVLCRGGSAVVSPAGRAVCAGPLYDGEGILVADLDLGRDPPQPSSTSTSRATTPVPDVFHA